MQVKYLSITANLHDFPKMEAWNITCILTMSIKQKLYTDIRLSKEIQKCEKLLQQEWRPLQPETISVTCS